MVGPYAYFARGMDALGRNTPERYAELSTFFSPRDPTSVTVSEQDVAVQLNTNLLRPANRLLTFDPILPHDGRPSRLPHSKSKWEATYSPRNRKYLSMKDKWVNVKLRPDIVYGRTDPDVGALDFGDGLPAPLFDRAYAVLDFKRQGYLSAFVHDLRAAYYDPVKNKRLYTADTMEHLKQLVSYAFGLRTAYALIMDGDYTVLIHFHKMVIRAEDTPEEVWNRGHGEEFTYTILTREQSHLNFVCVAGFLRKAAEVILMDF
ncbi:hypothetical protein LZ31DRAFT_546623 [Colletotrichum somersetense]|nr:hypothetical protein LZ31DRAFT_546623 [Colletotrichum somersetense]